MLKSINQWVFPAGMPPEKALSLAAEAGFQAFEVCLGEDGPTSITASEEDLDGLRRHADRFGLELSSVATGLGWQYPLTSPDPRVRDKGKECIERTARAAHVLGADAALVVPGVVDAGTSYDEAIERAIDAIQDLLPLAEQLQVCLAIENVWNKFLLSPVEMRDFIDQFESPCIGAYADVGNLLVQGYPEQWLRILGRRVRKVHMKDFKLSIGNINGFVMLLEGDVDWPAVMAALRAIGYQGPLTAEYGPYAHGVETTLRHLSAALDAILAL
ncbi:MAG TPA: sugar phosphate isomerase/epimerase family protein [Candidatus Hydrogenedentes bacterium]|nr:sugar phosphate isomerase/epimerase family protein [Candidatus Hydrogenedentota bacterium]